MVFPICYSICIFWTHHCIVKPNCSIFRTITASDSGVPIFLVNLMSAVCLYYKSDAISRMLLENEK